MCFTFSMRSWVSIPNSTHPCRFPRSSRRPLVIASALVSVLVLAAGCSSAKSALETPQADASEVSVLFSVLAPSMDVAMSGDSFTLSIPANSSTAWFTDRPDRNAGTMTVADLVSTWSAQGFDADPPNAAVAVTVNGEQRQHVVELSDPRVEGAMVSFHSVDVGDDQETDPIAGRSSTHDVAVGSFGPSELFIDNASTPPCSSSITTTSFTDCLLAPNQKVNFQATSPWTNGCIEFTRVVAAQNEFGSVTAPGSSTTPISITGSQGVLCLQYPSGKLWTLQVWPNAVTLSFGVPDEGPDDR